METVDVSLMNVGMWTMSPGIVSAPYVEQFMQFERGAAGNPVTNHYRTRDGRWIYLVLLQSDRFWAELCGILDRPDMIGDPRFVDGAARFQNRVECIRELDRTFATHSFEDWRRRLTRSSARRPS